MVLTLLLLLSQLQQLHGHSRLRLLASRLPCTQQVLLPLHQQQQQVVSSPLHLCATLTHLHAVVLPWQHLWLPSLTQMLVCALACRVI
jgi:hypothetical protein